MSFLVVVVRTKNHAAFDYLVKTQDNIEVNARQIELTIPKDRTVSGFAFLVFGGRDTTLALKQTSSPNKVSIHTRMVTTKEGIKMSEFYGRLQGGRGEVTRTGSKSSGIEAQAESWSSVVRVRMHSDETAHSGHMTNVTVTDKHGNQTGLRLYLDTDALASASRSGDPKVEAAIAAAVAAVEDLDRVVNDYVTAEVRNEDER